ncbi:demethoxyubiquinone hydroxylase family protein [Sphingomonas sp. S1-29]|uniref:demethoxyubiquinone hydroxylase family protein n=1 Tax=Sphingomonas sp. S1-29 TaxID=2991074 RepID=UPI00223F0723|nr:demethoxyubiquinone hydroxylase family protein [Sphingomonas sp. S1-29]UZK68423.1 demethoxyubiquinone hydroxylase family protein [Sphingomonas sp. S1-29]
MMTTKRWRPGDRREKVQTMIRVDQAGEYGATRIYAGQLAIMGDHVPAARAIAGMAAQEDEHCAYFDKLIVERGVRPTLLQPFWDSAGYALGVVTAAIGPEAAMACTVAVETEIDEHYRQQLEEIGIDDAELRAKVSQFRDEEIEHKEAALAAGAELAPAYPLMTAVIRAGCRVAIAASKRI